MIHICALSGVGAVAAGLENFDLLSLLSPTHGAVDWSAVAPRRHLSVSFHDILEPTPGLVAPDADALRKILAFGDVARDQPLLIHCWAGVSRSSAAAYVIACAHNPGHEAAIASDLRRRAPFATPNRLMVALADDLLGRGGVMVDAVTRIGRGADAFEGTPYQLPVVWPQTPPSS